MPRRAGIVDRRSAAIEIEFRAAKGGWLMGLGLSNGKPSQRRQAEDSATGYDTLHETATRYVEGPLKRSASCRITLGGLIKRELSEADKRLTRDRWFRLKAISAGPAIWRTCIARPCFLADQAAVPANFGAHRAPGNNSYGLAFSLLVVWSKSFCFILFLAFFAAFVLLFCIDLSDDIELFDWLIDLPI